MKINEAFEEDRGFEITELAPGQRREVHGHFRFNAKEHLNFPSPRKIHIDHSSHWKAG
jgi:hypothetical protein